MKHFKKIIFITLILMFSLISVACNSLVEDTEENNLEGIEEIQVSDLTSDKSEESYLIKLDAIGNQILESDHGASVQEILNKAYEDYGDKVENIYYGDHKGKMLLSPPLKLPEDYDARQRLWYKEALEKELFQPEPYQDRSVQKNIQTIAKALYKGDELIGVIGMDYAIENTQIEEDSEDMNMTNDEKLKLPLEKRVELRNYVEDLKKVVENEENIDALKKYFHKVIENSNNRIETIYLANKNEIYLITPYVQLPDSYDPTVRAWYESAIKDNIYISDVYVDSESNQKIITISTKIELEEDNIGVLGIDFVIDL